MRKIIFALFCAAAMFTSCSEKENADETENTTVQGLSVSPKNLDFGKKAETKTVEIKTSEKWTVEVARYGQEWLTVTPTSGKGNATLNVSVSDIPDGTDNSSYFTVTAGTKSETVMVTQK